MTIEEKLQTLRDKGVIDMELSWGCLIYRKQEDDNIVFCGDIESTVGEPFVICPFGYGYNKQDDTDNVQIIMFLGNMYYNNGRDLENEYYKNLGHDLTYGRVCRWIEENIRISPFNDSTKWFVDTQVVDIVTYHNYNGLHKNRNRKDLPLSQQENQEEIIDFIISLLPLGQN